MGIIKSKQRDKLTNKKRNEESRNSRFINSLKNDVRALGLSDNSRTELIFEKKKRKK